MEILAEVAKGKSNSEIAEALACQAARVAYVSGTSFTNDAVEGLCGEIARLSPHDADGYEQYGHDLDRVVQMVKVLGLVNVVLLIVPPRRWFNHPVTPAMALV